MKQEGTLYTKEQSFILKGVAVLLMVWHHSFRTEKFFGEYHVNFGCFPVEDVVRFSMVCKICVSLFVFISGYGLYLALANVKRQEYSKWLYNRLLKLLAGYGFVYIICFGMILVFFPDEIMETYFSEGKVTGLIGIVCNMLGLQNFFGTPNLNGAWWYMSAAILFIIIAPVAKKIIDSYGTIFTVCAVIIVPRVFVQELLDENHIYKFVLIYVLGMIFAKNDWLNEILRVKSQSGYISRISRLLVEISGCAVSYVLTLRMPDEYYWEVQYALLPVFVILITVEFIAVIPILSGILCFIGKHSMNLYLIHNYARIYGSQWIYDNHFFLFAPFALLLFGLAGAMGITGLKKLLRYEQLVDKLSWK